MRTDRISAFYDAYISPIKQILKALKISFTFGFAGKWGDNAVGPLDEFIHQIKCDWCRKQGLGFLVESKRDSMGRRYTNIKARGCCMDCLCKMNKARASKYYIAWAQITPPNLPTNWPPVDEDIADDSVDDGEFTYEPIAPLSSTVYRTIFVNPEVRASNETAFTATPSHLNSNEREVNYGQIDRR